MIPVELPLTCDLNETLIFTLQLVEVVCQPCDAWIRYVPVRLRVRREVGILVLGHVLVRVKNFVISVELIYLLLVKAVDAEGLAFEDVILVAKTV